MSMYTALSGIAAAQTEIANTSHNIANVGTFGFKGSRVEFADIFSSSPMSVARTMTGSGVQVSTTSQVFTQGNVTSTGNVLDLAIEGPGFFAIRAEGGSQEETQFTRAGAFRRDVSGTIVNSAGSALLGWPVAQDGSVLSRTPALGEPMRVPPTKGAATMTTELSVAVNLPAEDALLGQQAAVPPGIAFSPDDPTSYAHVTPVSIFNEIGNPVPAALYFVKTDGPDATDPGSTWVSHLVVDGVEVPPSGGSPELVFDGNGLYQSGGNATYQMIGGSLSVSLGEAKVLDRGFQVVSAAHNGRTEAALTGLEINTAGTVYASYSDGETVAMGKVFLANFANPQGLRQMGATALSATAISGEPILGSPGETGFAYLRSGALERANVDLTQELVNLITSQRNYQASAKAMETSTSLSQTIINMRT